MNDTESHALLAREGWIHVAVALTAALLVTLLGGWQWGAPLWLVLLFVLQFFRDPHRSIPTQPDLAVSPADGRVVAVAQSPDPYLGRPALKISVFMNVFSVHSNRVPVSGKVRERWYQAGRFVNAALDKASAENERNALWLQDESGRDIVCVQVAGLVARRILCYVEPGDTVDRGQRYGFIRFGSRVDVYLPRDFQVTVTVGDKLTAGVDPLGRFA